MCQCVHECEWINESCTTIIGHAPIMAEASPQSGERSLLLPLVLTAVGLTARLWLAFFTFLNPDEAWHYLLAAQPSLSMAYRASLTTAHPPLLILLLWAWHFVSSTELWLRLPSALAGTAFCWMMFLWIKDVFGRSAALIGLTYLLFSPPLIALSAEVRQYPLLLFFCACSLYFLERGLREASARMMVFSGVSLALALLMHYSSLIFAFVIGGYALLRFLQYGPNEHRPGEQSRGEQKHPGRLLTAWIVGQSFALTLIAWLLVGHVAELKKNGLSNEVAATYVTTALFHSGQDRFFTFMFKSTTHLFRYFFSNGTVGVAGLILFLLGIGLLLKDRTPSDLSRSSSCALAVLLLLPFIITLALGLAGLYPYGGIRHDTILAPFAMAGISIPLARWKMSPHWVKPVLIAVPLLIGNLHPHPFGPYISPKNQSKRLLKQALDYLRDSAAPGPTLLTDYEGGLLLSYYLCPHPVVNLDPSSHRLQSSDCGPYKVITPGENLFIFSPESFSAALPELRQEHQPALGGEFWLFQAGWIGDKQKDLDPDQLQLGCLQSRRFGENIFLCRLARIALHHAKRGDNAAPSEVMSPLKATAMPQAYS